MTTSCWACWPASFERRTADGRRSRSRGELRNDLDGRRRFGKRLIRLRFVGAFLLLALSQVLHRLVELLVARRAGRLLEDLGAHDADVPGVLVRRRIALHVERQQREQRRGNREGAETDVLLVDAVRLAVLAL